MTQSFFSELKTELKNGLQEKGHPFRFGTLATIGLDASPQLRSVVLRKVSDDIQLTFYTDKRSNKINQLEKNNKVSILFYHPEKMLQITVYGVAHIIDDKMVLNQLWQNIHPNARKDYTTTNAPGMPISNSERVTYLQNTHHFCAITIDAHAIEYLKLQHTGHVKVKFSKTELDWEGTFLVP